MSRPAPRKRDAGGGPERDALRWLTRRPLTEAELRGRLEAAGHAAPDIDRTCEQLRSAGQLDDRKLAEHYLLARAARLGHGPQRLIRELVARGVARQVAESAWTEAEERGDVSVEELLERRVRRSMDRQSAPLDWRGYLRARQQLLRAGFELGAIDRALAPFRAVGDPESEPAAEVDHDLP